MRQRPKACKLKQRGASLVVSLFMLIAIMLLGLSATSVTLQGEKSARNERDRQLAFQAAEAALMDAETDIENSPAAGLSRSAIFSEQSAEGFESGCGAGDSNRYLGLCIPRLPGEKPIWQTVDLAETDSAKTISVPYGRFTGQVLQTDQGFLPRQLPRYVIELMTFNQPGAGADDASNIYFYRITAIGFGAHPQTSVVLQTFYRKGAN
jgi:type IV pilus assembly protein PilX